MSQHRPLSSFHVFAAGRWSPWRAGGIALLLGLLACQHPPARQPATGTQPADLVLIGPVHTMDPAQPSAAAVAVDEGRIVHVGTRASVQGFIGAGTKVEELEGRALLPGLHDSHNHLVWSGTELEDVVLNGATTIDELLARIAERAGSASGDAWIRGTGWDNTRFEGKLDKAQLDKIVPDRPVYMVAADGHTAWVNSAALAAAGITAATPDPAGGRIERDKKRQPTGILRESAASLVSDRMPPYPEAQVDQGLTEALEMANSYGITSIIDPAVKPWMLDGYQRFADRGALTVRVHAAARVEPGKGAQQLAAIEALRARYRSPMVQVNAVKLYIDGVIESKTAYMLKPYADGTNGPPNFTNQELSEIVVASDQKGFQIHAHAIGDGAIRQILDALDAVQAANGARDRRPILAHLQVIDPADVPRFGSLDVHAVFSPLWAYPDPAITELTVPVIGPERSAWLYPIAAVQRAGGVLVGASDWSVSPMDPFDAMETGVTRQDTDKNGGPALTPEHKATLQQMLEAYTINGARASFVERELGSITVGKRADLVVLDRDPFEITPYELSEIQVVKTLLDGREVYQAGN
jgi:predicted amidohydrolase YtcJ